LEVVTVEGIVEDMPGDGSWGGWAAKHTELVRPEVL
jgi:hypothetical protein